MILVKKEILNNRKVEHDDFYKLETEDFYKIDTKEGRENGRVSESAFSIYNIPIEYAGKNAYHLYSIGEAAYVLNGNSMPPFIDEREEKNDYNDNQVEEKLDEYVTGEDGYIKIRVQLPDESHPETYYGLSVIQKAYDK